MARTNSVGPARLDGKASPRGYVAKPGPLTQLLV